MKPSVIVWDLETVPDIFGFAAANDLVGKSDVEVREAPGARPLCDKTRDAGFYGGDRDAAPRIASLSVGQRGGDFGVMRPEHFQNLRQVARA